jgi:hypothetical protein
MNHQLVLGAALAAVLASGITTPAYAAGGKEKMLWRSSRRSKRL